MPSKPRRSGLRLGRSGPVSLLVAIVLIAWGLFTGSLDLGQLLAILRGETSSSAPSATQSAPASRATPSVSPGAPPAARFDYYLLALSWSPEYCAGEGADDRQQCRPGMRLGFVLHGLWPQSEGADPGFCSAEQMPQWASDRYPGLFPTDALLEHEWEKHGTCSGLGPEQYLALSRRLKDTVRIPEAYISPDKAFRATANQVEAAFVAANPGLDNSAVAVICTEDGRYLREVYACFGLDGKPTACDRGVDRDAASSCDRADFQVRSPR